MPIGYNLSMSERQVSQFIEVQTGHIESLEV